MSLISSALTEIIETLEAELTGFSGSVIDRRDEDFDYLTDRELNKFYLIEKENDDGNRYEFELSDDALTGRDGYLVATDVDVFFTTKGANQGELIRAVVKAAGCLDECQMEINNVGIDAEKIYLDETDDDFTGDFQITKFQTTVRTIVTGEYCGPICEDEC